MNKLGQDYEFVRRVGVGCTVNPLSFDDKSVSVNVTWSRGLG